MSTKDEIEERGAENITPERQGLLQQDSQAPKREIIVSLEVPTQHGENVAEALLQCQDPEKEYTGGRRLP